MAQGHKGQILRIAQGLVEVFLCATPVAHLEKFYGPEIGHTLVGFAHGHRAHARLDDRLHGASVVFGRDVEVGQVFIGFAAVLCLREVAQETLKHVNGIAKGARTLVGQFSRLEGGFFENDRIFGQFTHRFEGIECFLQLALFHIAVGQEVQPKFRHLTRVVGNLVQGLNRFFVMPGLRIDHPELVVVVGGHFSAQIAVHRQVGQGFGIALFLVEALANQFGNFWGALGGGVLEQGFTQLQQLVVQTLTRIDLGQVVRNDHAELFMVLQGLQIFHSRHIVGVQVRDVAVVVLGRSRNGVLGGFGRGQLRTGQIVLLQQEMRIAELELHFGTFRLGQIETVQTAQPVARIVVAPAVKGIFGHLQNRFLAAGRTGVGI